MIGFDSLALFLSLLSAAAVGFAVFQHGGEYTPRAIRLISVAILASLAAVFAGSAGRNRAGPRVSKLRGNDLTSIAALLLLAGQFIALLRLWPAGDDQTHVSTANHVVYLSLLSLGFFTVLLSVPRAKWLSSWWFPALLTVHALLGVWTVRSSPSPHIDVWVFQQQGPQALLAGKNPYDWKQVRFPDIYLSTHGDHQRVYGEGLVENDVLKFGFPYPPVSLYCSTVGYLIGRDTRYAQALALTLAGLLIGYGGAGRLPKIAAALLLFTPTEWFVLGRAWTEPFVVMFLAFVLFCAGRGYRSLLPVALGLFLASKQYLVFAVPLTFLLLETFSWRAWGTLLLKAAGVAAAVTLPMALWDWKAFWFSTITVQAVAPFRWDALSYLVWIGLNIDSKYTSWTWLAFAAVVPAMGLCLWRCRRSAGGYSLALGVVYLVFIALNKQAFCNYYFFVIACLCGAAVDGSYQE